MRIFISPLTEMAEVGTGTEETEINVTRTKCPYEIPLYREQYYLVVHMSCADAFPFQPRSYISDTYINDIHVMRLYGRRHIQRIEWKRGK